MNDSIPTITRQLFSNDTARWNAVQRRDPSSDGTFVYAVRTTKIYCRPICKARLARRANVGFYHNARDAEKAGYRACKRCKPKGKSAPEAAAAVRIRRLLEQELQSSRSSSEEQDSSQVGDSLTTESLARRAQVSKWHFHRKFKELMGVTPAEYFQQRQQAAGVIPSIDTSRSTPITPGSFGCEEKHDDNFWGNATAGDDFIDQMSWESLDWQMLLDSHVDDVPLQDINFDARDTLWDCWLEGS